MKTNNIIVFAPLRGWYAGSSGRYSTAGVFAPLRGWYYDVRL